MSISSETVVTFPMIGRNVERIAAPRTKRLRTLHTEPTRVQSRYRADSNDNFSKAYAHRRPRCEAGRCLRSIDEPMLSKQATQSRLRVLHRHCVRKFDQRYDAPFELRYMVLRDVGNSVFEIRIAEPLAHAG